MPLSGVCKVTAAVEIGLSSIDVVIFIDPYVVKAFLRFKSILIGKIRTEVFMLAKIKVALPRLANAVDLIW